MTLYTITSSLRDWAATIRKWKEFKQETGTWPLLSIVSSSLHTIGFIVGGGFLTWYSGEHRWSTNRFTLILVAVTIPYVLVWSWLRDRIYVGEIRRARLRLGHNPNFVRSREPLHHKREREMDNLTSPKGRTGNWSKLLATSWQIDNAIFIIFLTFVAAAIIAKTLFWLLGW
jgi:hypothetical protein